MSKESGFSAFPKIPRLSRDCTITEKIDGTNASIFIGENGEFKVGSRKRWITPEDDNFGFARWAHENVAELMRLGPGHHFGEWWGLGIQRGYDQHRRRFSLFNPHRWGNAADRPACCDVVPILYEGLFNDHAVNEAMGVLIDGGSQVAPGYMKPEGIVIYHHAAKAIFKKTLENDEKPKGSTE